MVDLKAPAFFQRGGDATCGGECHRLGCGRARRGDPGHPGGRLKVRGNAYVVCGLRGRPLLAPRVT